MNDRTRLQVDSALSRGRQSYTLEVMALDGNLFPVVLSYDAVDAADVAAWVQRLRRNRMLEPRGE